jgi:hypothetical protein
LGGYSGVEIGLAMDAINIEDLSHLGCSVGSAGCANTRTYSQNEYVTPRLSLGKGLFNDVDIFLEFLPPLTGTRTSDFGGTLRWSFFQAQYIPLNISVAVNANQITIQDQFNCLTYGSDVIAGLNINDFSLFIGGGYLFGIGKFTGGDSGDGVVSPSDPALNPNTNILTQRSQIFHSVLGVTFHYGVLFLATEIDRYQDAVYSGKVGLRF